MIPVIIPAYRAPDKLKKCLHHLGGVHQGNVVLSPWVRDNSNDNIYYTKAINEGIEQARGAKYILVLTQDCYLAQDCVMELYNFMEANPKCGIASPIQAVAANDGEQTHKVTWGGSMDAWPFGKAHQLLDTKPYKTYWANGACMLIRMKMINEIGVLDDNMRFICSDADYSFTARSRGWDVYVIPDAMCEHELDGSSAKNTNIELSKIKIIDAAYFTRKWLSGDLYRSLSYEGYELKHETVVAQLEKWLTQVERISFRQGDKC